MTIYLEREKFKVLGLVGPLVKRVWLSTFMVHPGLMVWGLSYLLG